MFRGTWISRLALAAGVAWAVWPWAPTPGQEPARPGAEERGVWVPPSFSPRSPSRALAHALAERVPLHELPERARENVRLVMETPTLSTRGPIEVFRGRPAFYQWLLNHPDRAVYVWRRLGAKCMEITDRGGGQFGWTDKHGSDVHWETVYHSPVLRVWYAEGCATPGPLLPTVPVRAVAVLHFAESRDPLGQPLLHHQADLYVQTDSKAAVLITKLLGSSAPQLAKQCVGQMELFFSALVWYADRCPDRALPLLFEGLAPGSLAARELRQVFADGSGVRNQESGGRNQGAGIRNQGAEVKSQSSETP